MKKKFDKNDMVFYFQQAEFPNKLICKDVLVHSELIFNDDAQEPEIISIIEKKKKNKLSECFLIEDELESSKYQRGGGFKRGQSNRGGGYSKPKPRDWRENKQQDEPASSDFFDEFKGQTDKEKVTKFKTNLHLGVTVENSITIDNLGFIDHINKSKGKNNSLKFYESDKKNSDNKIINDNNTLTADNFFDNADKIMGNVDSNAATLNSSNKFLQTSDQNPETLNIKSLFKVNEHLQYPKEEHLWYIFHPMAKSSFGPLTSSNIEEMYNSKMLNGLTEIRFIDIYNLKNRKPFAFFKLKDIDNPSFLEEIEISGLLKIAVALRSKNVDLKKTKEIVPKEEQGKEQVKEINNSEIEKKSDLKQKEIKQTANTNTNTNPNVTKNTKKEIFEPESIYQVKKENKKTSDLFEIQTEVEKTDKKGIKSKVLKGKPVELDVKLGKYKKIIYF